MTVHGRRWPATHVVVAALLVVVQLMTGRAALAAFDHGYAAWDAVLKRHVAWDAAGVATTVDYAGLARERQALQGVLAGFTAVTPEQYRQFDRDQRLAFLINAYNAFTLELILTAYPDLNSIKDLGSLFSSPWRKRFFELLGEQRHLDNVEHDMIRATGAFDEPRIHFAVNCASIGCPALRPEAIVATRLRSQLADSTRRFLSDRSRNRYDPRSGELQVSKIFDWYGDDFERGHSGIESRKALFASHAELLADDEVYRRRIRDGAAPLDFLDYDWSLNDRR